jgi:hypothetical protein
LLHDIAPQGGNDDEMPLLRKDSDQGTFFMLYKPMKCKTCNATIPDKEVLSEAAKIIRAKPSKKRAEASRLNGAKGGRPVKPVK